MGANAPKLLNPDIATDLQDQSREVFTAKNTGGTAITRGQALSFDVGNYATAKTVGVIATTGTDDTENFIGVADEDIAVNGFGKVCRRGICKKVAVKTAITAGHGLQVSDTAGALEDSGAAASTTRIVGIALTADSAGFAEAWLLA